MRKQAAIRGGSDQGVVEHGDQEKSGTKQEDNSNYEHVPDKDEWRIETAAAVESEPGWPNSVHCGDPRSEADSGSYHGQSVGLGPQCSGDSGWTQADCISSDISSSECESGAEDGECKESDAMCDTKQEMICQEDGGVGSSGSSSLESGPEQTQGTRELLNFLISPHPWLATAKDNIGYFKYSQNKTFLVKKLFKSHIIWLQ